MNDIELRLFRYFIALCEERHFSRAADRLHISPPTLTNQIQKLEKHLGAQLIRRKGKSLIEITQTGMRFLESARRVVHEASEAELTARQAARGEVGRLEIGFMVSTAYSGLVQRCVGSFQRSNPGIEISLRQSSTVKIINSIMSNELDAGFARQPKQYPLGLTGFTICRRPIVLALPGDHPLARTAGPIAAETLANEKFVTTSVAFDLSFTRHAEAIAKLGGYSPKVGKRAEDLTTVLTYVSAGYGIAALSAEMTNCQVPNVVYKKLAGNAGPEVVIAFMYREKETSPACKVLIEAMRAYALESTVAEHRTLKPVARSR